jgi:hypothetical protein
LSLLVAHFRAVIIAALAAAVIITAQPAPPKAEATGGADAVIAIAMRHLGAPWVWGAEGPYVFDCTGLVIYSFRNAGYYSRIGSGAIRSAAQFYYWFRSRGLATRTGGRRGDLVVYGGGKHVGIYLGNGKVISTLTRGVTVHGLYAVTSGFTAFLRTGLSSSGSSSGSTAGAAGKSRAGSSARSHASGSRVVKAYRLNFRTGPGTNHRIKTVLKHGARLTVLGSGHDSRGRSWIHVRTSSGRVGWVAKWWTLPG